MANTTKKVQETSNMVTIQITNKNLMDKLLPSFTELSKLPSNPKTGKIRYAIKRSLGSFQDAAERYNSARIELFEERAKMDENGNPQTEKDGSYIFESKELRKEAMEKLKELNEKEISLTIYPIRKSVLQAATGNISIGTEINLEGFLVNDVDADEEIEEEMKVVK